MATNHPPVSQKTSQKRENICKFIDPSIALNDLQKHWNIFDRIPENVWCFLLVNSMNYFRRLYPCESSQAFQVHCTCCTPWVKIKGCEKPPIKSETRKVQFCSSRVAPETCQDFVKCWAKVICLQCAIDWGNRFNQKDCSTANRNRLQQSAKSRQEHHNSPKPWHLAASKFPFAQMDCAFLVSGLPTTWQK